MTHDSEAAIDRILILEGQIARAPARSVRHRQLAAALRIEADHYCKTLDAEQAAEQFNPKI
jgi:hypothetical protein